MMVSEKEVYTGHLSQKANGKGPGECKEAMSNYLACMKNFKGVNEAGCRELAKSYLACRMDR